MSDEIILNAITKTLRTYLSYDESFIEFLLENPNVIDKQRIETIEHLEVIILSKRS
nr:hypothetical protein [uncultured Flavobacterium sp.]